MPVTLAFDVYGTLIDTHGVTVLLASRIGDNSVAFSHLWREKQLEYSFRRGLMQRYENFAVCTEQALDYTFERFNIAPDADFRRSLLQAYQTLPAFADVADGLAAARDAGYRLFAFSNGSANAVDNLLRNAGIRDAFIDIVRVDEIRSFKPDPAVYAHFLKRTGEKAENSWLVSSNPFDVIGARSHGMRAAWVKRPAGAIFDPWNLQPTIIIDGLETLVANISRAEQNS